MEPGETFMQKNRGWVPVCRETIIWGKKRAGKLLHKKREILLYRFVETDKYGEKFEFIRNLLQFKVDNGCVIDYSMNIP